MKLYLGKTDESGDKKLSFFICTYMIASSLNISVKTVLPISASAWNMVSLGFEAFILMALMFALPVLFFRARKSFILVEAVFIILYFVSFLIGKADNSLLISTAFWTLAVCIPLGIAGASVFNKEILFKYLRISAFIEYPILCIALLSMGVVGSYNMSASYSLVIPVLFLFHSFFEDRRFLTGVLGVIGVILIVFYGARGPFLCVAIYVFAKLFMSRGNIRITIMRIGLLIGVIVLIVNWETILYQVQLFLINNGISSYALQRLVTGKITETAGRSDLWEYYISLIKERPLTGYGLQGGWIGSGNGPHNMLIEYVLAFGIIVGGIISIGSIYILVRSFIKKNGTIGEIILIFASYNLTMYFVSGNWLEKPFFFLFAALSISDIHDTIQYR